MAAPNNPAAYEFGPFRFDAAERRLYRGADAVPLTPKVADTLLALLERQGRVVGKDELLRILWPDTVVEEGGLARNVSMLRKALGEEDGGGPYIETVPKRGYRFLAPLNRPAETPGRRKRPARFAVLAAVLVLAAAAAAVLLLYPRHPRPGAIAVVPLKDLSTGPAEEYFAEGMTDMLATELARNGARVVAVRRLGRDVKLEALGRLHVDAVVQGTVVRAGGQVRINAQLVETKTGRLLWADSYERPLADVLRLQDDVAQAVAREVAASVEPRAARAAPVAVPPEAFRAYLKGRFFWNKRTEAGLRKAIEYFQQAIEASPGYAAAYAGLADSWALLASSGYDALPPREAMPRAKAAALRALQFDSRLADAHTSLAYVLMAYDWDLPAAEREFRLALEANPGYATAHQWLAHLELARGRPERAAAEMNEALRLDPLSLPVNVGVGWCAYFARRYDEAIAQYRKTLDLDPDFPLAHQALGMALEAKGAYPEAIAEFRRADALAATPGTMASYGHACALAGDRAEARSVLGRLAALARTRYVPAIYFAQVSVGLGDKAKAAEWLAKAQEERSEYLIYVPHDPLFAPE